MVSITVRKSLERTGLDLASVMAVNWSASAAFPPVAAARARSGREPRFCALADRTLLHVEGASGKTRAGVAAKLLGGTR